MHFKSLSRLLIEFDNELLIYHDLGNQPNSCYTILNICRIHWFFKQIRLMFPKLTCALSHNKEKEFIIFTTKIFIIKIFYKELYIELMERQTCEKNYYFFDENIFQAHIGNLITISLCS